MDRPIRKRKVRVYETARVASANKRAPAYPYPSSYKMASPNEYPKYFQKGYDRSVGYFGRFEGDGELKFHNFDYDVTPVPNGGIVRATINIIAQGTAEDERIGRKCTIRSIQWRYAYYLDTIANVVLPKSGDLLRLIVFVDKQCNGVAATVTQLLETADIFANKSLVNQGRFTILLDRLHSINYLTLTENTDDLYSQSKVMEQATWYKACNVPIEFSGVTGAIAEIRSNNIGILTISSAGSVRLESRVRIRYSDL